MITFTFTEKHAGTIIFQEDLRNICESFLGFINKKSFLPMASSSLQISFGHSEGKNFFEVSYSGVCVQSDDATNYLHRQLFSYLAKVTDVVFISSVTNNTQPNDIIFQPRPVSTKNALLLKNLIADDDIPEKYICTKTKEVMDNPVYIRGFPDVIYDKNQLTYTLFQQPIPKIPDTNLPMSIKQDIISKPDLKKEINTWVQAKFKVKLGERRESFLSLLKTYNLHQSNPETIGNALRRAAFKNNLQDFKSFLRATTNINEQGSESRRTAFHWAVLKNSTDIIKELMQLKADPFIKDAKRKTAVDYARESQNELIKSLVAGYAQGFEAYQPRSASNMF